MRLSGLIYTNLKLSELRHISMSLLGTVWCSRAASEPPESKVISDIFHPGYWGLNEAQRVHPIHLKVKLSQKSFNQSSEYLMRSIICIQEKNRPSESWDLLPSLLGFYNEGRGCGRAHYISPSWLGIKTGKEKIQKSATKICDQQTVTGWSRVYPASMIMYIWKESYREKQPSPIKFKELCRYVCTCHIRHWSNNQPLFVVGHCTIKASPLIWGAQCI